MGAPLDYYAQRYGTDKGWAHHYCPMYERYLGPYRDREFKLLEMGVQTGASLRMWRDYFHRARIVGIDITPDCERHTEGRIKVCIGPQEDSHFMREVHRWHGPFDVIIDDASHRGGPTIAALETLLPLVVPGGYYVIEDLEFSFIPEYVSENPKETSVGRLQRMVEEFVRRQTPLITGMHLHQNICFIERSQVSA